MADSIGPGRNQATNTRERFEGLIGENEAALLRVAHRLCRGDSDRAQDLLQDALVRAYQACVDGKFQWGLNERAWLIKILTNVFLNDCDRRKRRESSVDLDSLIAEDQAPVEALRSPVEDLPESSLMLATLDEPLERALAGLTDEFRACVVLVDVEGLEYAQAAEALGIPIGTVRSRLARARLQLHALLYDYAKEIRRV